MANIRATSSNTTKLYRNIEIMKFRRRRDKRARCRIRNGGNECIDDHVYRERKKERKKADDSRHIQGIVAMLREKELFTSRIKIITLSNLSFHVI
jgi:hypothetical protein